MREDGHNRPGFFPMSRRPAHDIPSPDNVRQPPADEFLLIFHIPRLQHIPTSKKNQSAAA
jgi:hypothetical protein